MSAPIDDGGPAFPNEPRMIQNGNATHVWNGLPGMTLRDWFAGQALAGLCASDLEGAGGQNEIMNDHVVRAYVRRVPDTAHYFAVIAYKQSDAMLAARKAKP